VTIVQAGKEAGKCEDAKAEVPCARVIKEINMANSVYATPVPAHGTLFINNRNMLFAIENGAQGK
jgi:hypothetical protein